MILRFAENIYKGKAHIWILQKKTQLFLQKNKVFQNEMLNRWKCAFYDFSLHQKFSKKFFKCCNSMNSVEISDKKKATQANCSAWLPSGIGLGLVDNISYD